MLEEWVFKGLCWDFLKVVKAQTLKMVLISFFSIYLRAKGIIVKITTTGKFALKNLASWLDNLLSHLKDDKESKKTTERRSLQEQLQLQT